MPGNPPLVFSIGFNGYKALFRELIFSHEQYARRQGYDYVCAGAGVRTALGAECTWLKLMLILDALKTGRDWVMCIDADCLIRPDCPDLRGVSVPGKTVYCAPGLSGRPSSGVMIIRNDPSSIAFFEAALSLLGEALAADDAGEWGENGAVIHIAREAETFQALDRCWNNTTEPELDDHIRHYTGRLEHLTPQNVKERDLWAKRDRLRRAPRLPKNDALRELHHLRRLVLRRHSVFCPVET